ncbi:hypothetical protein JCM16303_006167 [Sporobolomyces ruberrimus]
MAITSPELLVKAFSKDSIDELWKNELECLPEIETHLKVHPLDYNFNLLCSDAGKGYGTLICMEEGCYTEIAMDPSFIAPGGGIARGFGSLAKYWDHIKTSATHEAARNARIAVEQAQASTSTASSPAFSRTALKAHNSGLSSEMDQLTASDRKPQLPSMSGSSKGSGSFTVPKKRTSLKPHSSAGIILDDDDDLLPLTVDKKPRLDVKPEVGVLADRGNAPRSSDSGVASAKTPAEKIQSLEARVAKYQTFANELRSLPLHQREPNHFEELNTTNAKLARLSKELADCQLANGIVPRPFIASAGPSLALGGGVGGIGAGGVAGGTDWHLDEAARQRLALEQLRNGLDPNDPMALVLAQASGSGIGGVAGPSSDGSNDPHDMYAGGRRMRAGTQGADFQEFCQKAVEGESFEGNANVDAAAAALGLKSQHECVPNMGIPLMPHQLIGVAWMKAQEEESKHYGGILADEMGLGKTVESIALMCANESKDPAEKSTLIVAPLALLEQWKEEIEEKTANGYFSILVYHGPERKKIKLKHLQKFDVVLTTFSTLVLDYPDDEGATKKARAKAKKEGGEPDDYFEFQEAGPLLKMSWYRVILDEAQNIRNRQTKMSRAVAGLDSLFRWCLTGTPVTNSLADLFPLFRYIQIKPWYTWESFREHVVMHEKSRGDLAGKRAQAILRTCMLRRKKDSKLDGKELISLPNKTIELFALEFSEEEREIYDAVEKKAQIKFKKMLRMGTVLKNYSHVLVMLLRLRQLCFHPCLIADAEATLEKKEQTKELVKNEIKRAYKELGDKVVGKFKAQRLDAAVARVEAEKSAGESVQLDECSVCLEDVLASEQGGSITRCGHIFCHPCITETINHPVVEDAGDEESAKCKADQRPCPICRSPVGEKDLWPLEAFEPPDETLADKLGTKMEVDDDEDDADEKGDLDGFIVNDDDDEYEDRSIKKKAPKQPNRAVIQDSDDEDDGLLASEAEEDFASESRKKDKGKGKVIGKAEAKKIRQIWMKKQETSTKMLWCLAELERLQAENPDDKVIIISSFTSMLDLLQDFLDSKDIKTCRYQGDMNAQDRLHSLKVLKKSKKCKVMLLSLKCGGVGLTLTRANRVISLDLAWSFAVEAQAYDRTHRIGQLKEVFVKRLTIANTVEQRIYDLQVKKQGLADASLGEGKAQKLGKLTVKDLANLFGI